MPTTRKPRTVHRTCWTDGCDQPMLPGLDNYRRCADHAPAVRAAIVDAQRRYENEHGPVRLPVFDGLMAEPFGGRK